MRRIKPKPILVPRTDAAVLVGVAPETLRGWANETPRRGPEPVRLSDSSRGRVYYRFEDVQRFAADPESYNRAIAAQAARE